MLPFTPVTLVPAPNRPRPRPMNPDLAITAMLVAWQQGDDDAEARLMRCIYPVLREIAQAQVRRNRGVLTLSATELAHEAYERLAPQRVVDWKNRDHFFAIAATVIRRVVVDYLRERNAEKRGGGIPFVGLDEVPSGELPANGDLVDWLAVDEALNDLAEADPKCARVIELRLFSGMSVDQIATVMESSTATVGRQWRFARSWLAERLDLPDLSRD
jgi:RNA polymerase sigma factor (TIGR02999 family)